MKPMSAPAVCGCTVVVSWDLWHHDWIGLILFAVTIFAMSRALHWWNVWRGPTERNS